MAYDHDDDGVGGVKAGNLSHACRGVYVCEFVPTGRDGS